MSLSPDQSRFTACVIGEATPAEQASFDAGLLADPDLREEAVTLSRTAHRLATALKREAPVSLSITQRHRVLHHGAAGTTPLPRKPARPTWTGPALATAGIAAALVLVLYALPGHQPETGNSSQETHLSAVTLQPRTPPRTGALPAVPAPDIANNSPASALPDAPSQAGPIHAERQGTMAATPPLLKVGPLPAPPSRETQPDFSAPGQPLPGKTKPTESFATPQVLPP